MVEAHSGTTGGGAQEGSRLADPLYAGLAPIVFRLLHFGARLGGADPSALRQRTGVMPACATPCVWLHGASAGEMAAAANLVALLRARGLQFAAAYTTTNTAGLALIERRLGWGDVSALAPWDMPRWVARAIEGWQPAALVLIETELWPALIRAAAQRGVPVLCASARIYPRDVPRYRLIRRFLRPTLERLTMVLAQTDRERARFVALGAPPGRCVVAGNLKHAGPPPCAAAAFRHAVGLAGDERVWVAGSVHADEAELLWAACARLPAHLRRVIVAPRHATECPVIERGARARGWVVTRRSAPAQRDWDVLLLDTMGELRDAYASAVLAVLGGSLAPHGGHDPTEPLRCGTPVLFGPHTAHVESEASALCAAVSESLVATPDELAARIAAWMSDEALRQTTLLRQRATLPDPEMVGARYADALEPWLPTCRTAAIARSSS